MLRTIERPRPVPLDREFSCAKGVKSFERRKSLEMPLPVSVTVNVTIDLGMGSEVPGCSRFSISEVSNLIRT